MSETLKAFAPAKINLSLEVRGKRPDGYHELRTVMQAVGLWDEMLLRPRRDGKVAVSCDMDGVPTDEDNLVVQAATLLKRECDVADGVDMELHKSIPPGAGLGGGSSDCAAALRGLNMLWGLGLGADELEEMGGRLGSDVPFFIRGGAAVCTGRGEKVTQLTAGPRLHYALVIPNFPVSTASVYARCPDCLTMTHGGYNNIKRGLRKGSPEIVGSSLFNALQESACREYPQLAEVKTHIDNLVEQLQSYGQLLCGSGSSIFSLHASRKGAERAARRLNETLGVRCEPVSSLPDWGLYGLLEREESSPC